jgi:hypothetical protein
MASVLFAKDSLNVVSQHMGQGRATRNQTAGIALQSRFDVPKQRFLKLADCFFLGTAALNYSEIDTLGIMLSAAGICE